MHMKVEKIRKSGHVSSQPQRMKIDRPVLVIEDQRALSQITETLLRTEWDCEVKIAASLSEARQLLEVQGSEFMAAICDLNLPDAPYGEVIDLVGEYGVPAIALTGAFGEDLREMVVKKGVVDYVLKEGINSYQYVVGLVGRLYKNASIKTLIVDDSLSARAVLKHMLNAQRLNVFLAEDGEQALKVLEQNPDIKLVLVDYNMPRMDGFAFTLEARKIMGKDRLAIIGLSGENNGTISARFLKNGANDFISKPYSYEELVCRVTQNLEMLEQIESIWNIANRDYLTGMYNRRFFFDEGSDIHEHAQENKLDLFVAMMDIDHFKKVNDTYGHDCGDFVLKHFAMQLFAHFPNDLVARLGGEEFAILISGEGKQSVTERLSNFLKHIERETVHFREFDIEFTVSIGGSSDLQENLDRMLKKADSNLYQAKKEGRNKLVV